MAMDDESKPKHGIFLRCRSLMCIGIFVTTSFIIAAVLAHYLKNCKCGRASLNISEEESTPTPESPVVTNLRLPRNLRPIHYQLRLHPFFNNFTFYGNVEIQIECLDDTDTITIHGYQLLLNNESINLLSVDDTGPQVESYEYDSSRQFFIFKLNENLQASNFYNLSLQFHGVLGDNLAGFYRRRYDDDRLMASTQFQPTDARRAFPCFDEPDMKARFTITLVRPKGYISLSNMPRKFEINETNGYWDVDEYFTTPNMSTYLLAFIVTNFSHVSKKSDNGVEFRVYSRHSAHEQTKFAIDSGPMILDFFDEFFKIPYPLPKQDMIAIPDFGSGAMENWGLITFRENMLLYDSKSSIQRKESIASIIAHELAHQWFGNLVTPAWWDEIWLNEGFATYMAEVAIDHLFKQWQSLDRFINSIQLVLKQDSLKSSHPIYEQVENPDQINEIFDLISYTKGAAIIRMLVCFIGNDIFREGLKSYFEEMKYNNAVQDDLWRHMTQVAKRINRSIDIKKIMDSWTLQTGYPVVTVSRNNHDQTAIVTQRIFHLNPEDKQNSESSSVKWEIPLSFTTQNKPDFNNTLPTKWMHDLTTETSVTFTWNDGVPSGDKWIIFNVQQTGYYRVNYQNENWVMLTKQLVSDYSVIHVINRAQLIDDAFNLARADELDYEIALNLSQYLIGETELVPWIAALTNFAYIRSMLSRTEIFGLWMTFESKLIRAHYNAIGFKHFSNIDENYINLEKQTLFVAIACSLNFDDCIEKSVSLFNNWISNISSISPNLKSIVLCKAIQRGNINEWNSLWNHFVNSNVDSEKSLFLHALTCTQEPWILSKLLNMIMAPRELVRFQDIANIVQGISANNVGRYILFDFVRNKIEELHAIFSEGRLLASIVLSAMNDFNTPFELNQIKEFFHKHSNLLTAAKTMTKQVIEETELNVSWMNHNYEKIKNWLEDEIKKM